MAANIRFSNPKTLAKPPGYSYVVEATGPNRLIFIAGQLGLDMGNKLVGAPGDFRAQANQAVENLKLALADAGATIKDVVKINNYLVDMSHIAIFREVRDAISTCRRRRRAPLLRSRSWRGPAPCSKSRRSRCCRRKLAKRQGESLRSVVSRKVKAARRKRK